MIFSVLLHGSHQKVWQSLLVKSLQKKNQITKKNRIFTTTQTKQHVVKSTFFFFAAANATTSGGGDNDWVIPNTSEVFQMAFSMT